MVIVLTVSPDVINRSGDDSVTMAAGQHLKIETSPDGEDVLDAVVPIGKSWEARISVFIVESDA